jgi:hypothetical protein
VEKSCKPCSKDGVLQPLEPLPLEEMRQVTVTIADSPVIPDVHLPDTKNPGTSRGPDALLHRGTTVEMIPDRDLSFRVEELP